VELIGDAYCVGRPIDVERAPVRLCTLAERSARREMGRKLCESGIPAKQVLDCAAAVSSLAGAPAEGGMEFTAQVNAAILYLSEDDALCGVETDIPVSCRVDLPEGCECACRCRTVGEATAVPVTGGLEVRFEAEFAWTITREEQAACVTDVKPGTVESAGPRPSVVIRRVERGEALWDIAKACGSTVDNIRCANTLPGEEAEVGALLLIPARRS
ncbi:MAG: LysM peptidoglycan-binding domain-containing protein, partial [Oscillospiraceae bacterium]|nr:LysM peptidoglycan-binding domain-containing protein [Oscillospiraceae bacterium]